MKTIFLYVNGILNFPGSAENWTGRAVTYTHLTTEARAEKVEYLSFATISRLMGQRNRSLKLARTLAFYSGWEVNLVAHSNGCAVALDALRYLEWPHINRLVFFSPACERDCLKNGITQAQHSGILKSFEVHIAGKDGALRAASSVFGRLFGYGTMGLKGPCSHLPDRTLVQTQSEWGHSDWWKDWNFPWTMRQILRDKINPAAVTEERNYETSVSDV